MKYEGRCPGRWHDIDLLDDNTALVAGIGQDRVFRLNLTNGLIEKQYNFESDFSRNSGGAYPCDWTHVNDVEKLSDGRIMVSPRNFDRVVFLNPDWTLNRSWTLGEEDNHSILFEQHNPDYIPVEHGGPSVLVGDSENNRIVEYQREGDNWTRTWTYARNLQWPRDADRLPNGHTLITDSLDNRVIEVDKSGDVVWSVSVKYPYEAERLGTGVESRGGEAAVRLNLSSIGADGIRGESEGQQSLKSTVKSTVKSLAPPKLLNGILFVLPFWMDLPELAALAACTGTATVWGAAEWILSPATVHIQSPIEIEIRNR